MKKYLARPWLALLLTLLTLTVRAQAPAWDWAKGATASTGATLGSHTAADAAGNVYVSGVFSLTITFGATTLTSSTGGYNGFVAKLSPTGAWLWAVRVGGTGVANVANLVLDRQGDLVLTGTFSDTATFGSTTLTTPSQWAGNTYVAKLSPMGTWLWATMVSSYYNNDGKGVAVTRSGDVLVTGTFTSLSPLTIGTTTLIKVNPNNFDPDIYVAKLSAAGSWLWAVSAGGSGSEEPGALSLDSAGHALISGYFWGATTDFGATTLLNAGSGSRDGFVARLSPTGGWDWAVSVGGGGDDFINTFALDSTGNAVCVGLFADTMMVGTTRLVSAGGFDTFVAKLSPAGTWLWATRVGGNSFDGGYGLGLDRQGRIFLSGTFSSPRVVVGTDTLVNVSEPGKSDVFVAGLSPTGSWQWAIAAGGLRDDVGGGLVMIDDHPVVTGYFKSPTLAFGSTTLPDLVGVGAENLFVTRVGAGPLRLPVAAEAPLTLAPNPAHETVLLTGAPAGTTATLLNALGRSVRAYPAGTTTLDLRGLAPGLYTVRAGAATRRLVVE